MKTIIHEEYQKTITSLLIGNTLFIDASKDDLIEAAQKINETLFKYNLVPNNLPNNKLLSPIKKLKINNKILINKWKFLIIFKFIKNLKKNIIIHNKNNNASKKIKK